MAPVAQPRGEGGVEVIGMPRELPQLNGWAPGGGERRCLGALVLRAGMILVGAWLIAQFHWVLYVFGAFLVFTGIKMWWAAGQEPDLSANPALRWINKHSPSCWCSSASRCC